MAFNDLVLIRLSLDVIDAPIHFYVLFDYPAQTSENWSVMAGFKRILIAYSSFSVIFSLFYNVLAVLANIRLSFWIIEIVHAEE